MLLTDAGALTHLSVLVLGPPHVGKSALVAALLRGGALPPPAAPPAPAAAPPAPGAYLGPYTPTIEESTTFQFIVNPTEGRPPRAHSIDLQRPIPGGPAPQGAPAAQPLAVPPNAPQRIVVTLIDVGGHPLYYSLWPSVIAAADAFMLVYDVGDKRSMHSLWKFYRLIIETKWMRPGDIPMLLVGSMVDTVSSDASLVSSSATPAASSGSALPRKRPREVSPEMGQEFASILRIPHVETTAKAPKSIAFCFRTLIAEAKLRAARFVSSPPDNLEYAARFRSEHQKMSRAGRDLSTLSLMPGALPPDALMRLSHSSVSSVVSGGSASGASGSYPALSAAANSSAAQTQSSRFSFASKFIFRESVEKVKDRIGDFRRPSHSRKGSAVSPTETTPPALPVPAPRPTSGNTTLAGSLTNSMLSITSTQSSRDEESSLAHLSALTASAASQRSAAPADPSRTSVSFSSGQLAVENSVLSEEHTEFDRSRTFLLAMDEDKMAPPARGSIRQRCGLARQAWRQLQTSAPPSVTAPADIAAATAAAVAAVVAAATAEPAAAGCNVSTDEAGASGSVVAPSNAGQARVNTATTAKGEQILLPPRNMSLASQQPVATSASDQAGTTPAAADQAVTPESDEPAGSTTSKPLVSIAELLVRTATAQDERRLSTFSSSSAAMMRAVERSLPSIPDNRTHLSIARRQIQGLLDELEMFDFGDDSDDDNDADEGEPEGLDSDALDPHAPPPTVQHPHVQQLQQHMQEQSQPASQQPQSQSHPGEPPRSQGMQRRAPTGYRPLHPPTRRDPSFGAQQPGAADPAVRRADAGLAPPRQLLRSQASSSSLRAESHTKMLSDFLHELQTDHADVLRAAPLVAARRLQSE
ncbi:hypothetical protein HK105_208735 [Polyrhizophydium stewartii]|uniref:Uncharacterized protein n=1 Tax=Polyrhizophydium stewartii TaxID=2732419 RepID=A0ABR4MWX4_9FUNG